MFRTASRPPAARRGQLVIAAGVAAAVLLAPTAASASGPPAHAESFAQARFLGGTLLGEDLAGAVSLRPATAKTDGDGRVSEERNPLSATLLDAITVAPGPITVAEGAPGIDVGAVGQYAIARPDGSSYAATGAIGSDGAVAISPAAGTTATIDLGALLGGALAAELAGLRLEVRGIAAEAEARLDEVRGDYALADARLLLTVPALASAPDRAAAALGPVQQALAELAGPTGTIARVLDGVLVGHSGALGILGVANVDVRVSADLAGLLDALSGVVLSDRALTVDLGTGVVAVDLAVLPSGSGLEGLEPGAELLSPAVVRDITSGIQRLLGNWVDDLERDLLAVLRATDVSATVSLSVLEEVQTGERVIETVRSITQVVDRVTGQVLGILDPQTGQVTSLVPGITGESLERVLGGLDGLLAQLLGLGNGVVTRVVTEVDQSLEPVLSLLETRVDVGVSGTLAQLQSGGVAAHADLLVLGVPVSLDAALLVGPVAQAVIGALLGDGGALDRVAAALDADVLAPVTGALGSESGDGVHGLLDGLVSLRANVQQLDRLPGGGTVFSQTALRVSVLGGQLATLDLATATVGPNIAGSGGPGGPGDDGGPGGGGWASLASTGLPLALLAVLLGLLALGVGAFLLHRRLTAGQGTSEELIA